MTTAAQIEQAVSHAGPHIGDVVFLRLWQATAKRERLEEIANRHGFPVDLLPSPMGAEAAWQQAMRTAKVDGFLLRPIIKDEKAIIWGAVREDVDPADTDLEYALENRLALLRDGERTVFEDPGHPATVEVGSRYAELLGSVTSDHIRAMVRRVCKSHGGVAIGTEFFVPGEHAQLLRAMRAVVEELGASQLWLLPIHDTTEGRETLGRAVRASLEDDLSRLSEEIASFGDDTRISTMEKRLERFDEIRSQAALYTGILEVTHSDLQERMRELESKVAEMIGLKRKGESR